MLRHQPLIVMGLGAFACIPVGAQGHTLFEQLRTELTRTDSALDELKHLEEQADLGVPLELEQLRLLSETPSTPPDIAQLRLEGLQLEVRELGVQLDQLRARRGEFPAGTVSSSRRLDLLGQDLTSTDGLDPKQRQALAKRLELEDSGTPEMVQDSTPQQAGTGALIADESSEEPDPNMLEDSESKGSSGPADVLAEWRASRQPKPKGHSTTALGKARAQYRAGHIAEALTGFEALDEDPEAVFWAARCYERLGESQIALERYGQLDTETSPALWRERAVEAIEFLQWKTNLGSGSGLQEETP